MLKLKWKAKVHEYGIFDSRVAILACEDILDHVCHSFWWRPDFFNKIKIFNKCLATAMLFAIKNQHCMLLGHHEPWIQLQCILVCLWNRYIQKILPRGAFRWWWWRALSNMSLQSLSEATEYDLHHFHFHQTFLWLLADRSGLCLEGNTPVRLKGISQRYWFAGTLPCTLRPVEPEMAEKKCLPQHKRTTRLICLSFFFCLNLIIDFAFTCNLKPKEPKKRGGFHEHKL